MREAVALVERAELRIANVSEPVVVGFRANGCASVYFGPDPAYHFNSARELRRAYVASELWKAEDGRLVVLRRERTGAQVELRSRTLSEMEQQAALQRIGAQLRSLCVALSKDDRYTLVAGVPSEQAVARAREWLATLPGELAVAERPHAE